MKGVLQHHHDWSQLPKEMLLEISKNISTTDFVRFRSVCRPWRAAVTLQDLPQQLPWLMIPYDEANDGITSFFSLSDQRVFHLHLPEFRGKRCCGSSHGWLVMVDMNLEVSLLHPFTRAQIQLPSLGPLCRIIVVTGIYLIWKALLSSNPSLGADCIVFAILAIVGKLIFCRVGDVSWAVVDFDKSVGNVINVAYCNGQFYALGDNDMVEVFNIGPSGKISRIISFPVPAHDMACLVVSAEGLMLVTQNMHYDSEVEGISFSVYSLDGSGEAFEVESICGNVLFVSNIHAFACHFPLHRGDCIYFVDDSYMGDDVRARAADDLWDHRIGLFYLEDESIEWLPWNFRIPVGPEAPIWVTPSLC